VIRRRPDGVQQPMRGSWIPVRPELDDPGGG
jgi:hypothetical protein